MVGLVVTITAMVCGALQQLPPVGKAASQLPPDAVLEATLKRNGAPTLATVIICGSGSAPANGLMKKSCGIGSKVCAWSGTPIAARRVAAATAKKIRRGLQKSL